MTCWVCTVPCCAPFGCSTSVMAPGQASGGRCLYTVICMASSHSWRAVCRGQPVESPEPEFGSADESSDSEYVSIHSSAGAFDALRSGTSRQQNGRVNSAAAAPPKQAAKASNAKAAKGRAAAPARPPPAPAPPPPPPMDVSAAVAASEAMRAANEVAKPAAAASDNAEPASAATGARAMAGATAAAKPLSKGQKKRLKAEARAREAAEAAEEAERAAEAAKARAKADAERLAEQRAAQLRRQAVDDEDVQLREAIRRSLQEQSGPSGGSSGAPAAPAAPAGRGAQVPAAALPAETDGLGLVRFPDVQMGLLAASRLPADVHRHSHVNIGAMLDSASG